ncbi:MAG: type VI secretion system contractile sheath large subunit, partial [Pirellulaceae bacterium]|nr:type VI secretion system contractile sheath large subunit [Pirellulaceae bacterium]
MATEKQAQAAAGAAATETTSLLEQAISATRQTERSRAEELLKTLTTEALKGTVSFDKDVTRSLTASIKAIDQA